MRTLRYSLWFVSSLALAGTLLLAGRRFAGPPSDPTESAVLEHANRIANDQPIFLDTNRAPTALMPGFPFVVSGLVRMFDAEAWEPRLVTLLATLLAAGLAGLVVSMETRSRTLGVASAGVVLMGLGPVAGVAGGASPASLMLLLVLAGFMSLRLGGVLGAVLAAFLLAAACFTDASAMWFAVAALLHLAVHDRRRLVVYGLLLVTLVGGGHVALSQTLGPWFNFYAWDAAFQAMHFDPAGLFSYLGTQLLGALGVVTLATVLSFALPLKPWRGDVGLWTWMGFAAIGAGLLATQSTIGRPEALRPAAVALAVAGPISIQRVTQHLAAWPGSNQLGGKTVVLTALFLQFVTLFAHILPGLQASI